MLQRYSNLNCDMQHSTRGRLQKTSFHLPRWDRLSDHTNKDMVTLCTLACGPLSRRSLLYWNRLLNNDMVGHSWRSKSRQDWVLNQENFLYHIIYRNQFYFIFFSMESQFLAKSNAVSFYPLTYSCYIICARSSYGGGLCMWDGGVY